MFKRKPKTQHKRIRKTIRGMNWTCSIRSGEAVQCADDYYHESEEKGKTKRNAMQYRNGCYHRYIYKHQINIFIIKKKQKKDVKKYIKKEKKCKISREKQMKIDYTHIEWFARLFQGRHRTLILNRNC